MTEATEILASTRKSIPSVSAVSVRVFATVDGEEWTVKLYSGRGRNLTLISEASDADLNVAGEKARRLAL